eukprot:gene8219-11125_t
MVKGSKTKSKINNRRTENGADSGDEFDENRTVASRDETTTEHSTSENNRNNTEFDLLDVMESISDRRSSKRLSGLNSLLQYLQTSKESIIEIDQTEELTLLLLKSIRNSSSTSISSIPEVSKCLDALKLLALYIGPDDDGYFYKPIARILTSISIDFSSVIRNIAIQSLSFITFVCSPESVQSVMNVLEDILCDDDVMPVKSTDSHDENEETDEISVSTKIAVAEGWMLLASLHNGDCGDILERSCDRMFDALLSLIDEVEVEAKVMAGKIFAFLWEVADDHNHRDESSSTEELGRSLCNNPSLVTELLIKIRNISKESSKRISKKDKKEQKSEFRDIEEWIVNGVKPDSTVRLQGAVIRLDSFQVIMTVDALKNVLGNGFHSSLKKYPIVKEILGVEFLSSAMDGDGDEVRVSKGSLTSKLRTKYLHQDRAYRKINSAFGGEEDSEEWN